mmetsp:Transcript_1897/g.5924  ORF Transcript_1897/g.5924 Transcript_1897/m.5924 type:complete len:179 (+) Transcript_1897:3-539(+)
MYREGLLVDHSFVWREGMGDWLTLRKALGKSSDTDAKSRAPIETRPSHASKQNTFTHESNSGCVMHVPIDPTDSVSMPRVASIAVNLEPVTGANLDDTAKRFRRRRGSMCAAAQAMHSSGQRSRGSSPCAQRSGGRSRSNCALRSSSLGAVTKGTSTIDVSGTTSSKPNIRVIRKTDR